MRNQGNTRRSTPSHSVASTARWFALAAACGLAFAGSAAEAGKAKTGPTYRRNRGAIAFQQKAFADFATEKAFGKHIAKIRRKNKTLVRDTKGNWTVHFIAFLRSAPGATKVNLVWYRRGKKREQVDFTEYTVQPSAKTLRSQTTLKSLQGFKVGDKLEGRITRLIRGREKIYARCRLQLK